MKKLAVAILALAMVAAAAFYYLTSPERLSAEQVALIPDGRAAEGEAVFWAGGCGSCHAAPGAKGGDKLLLAGGLELKTPFGTFVAPNISTDTTNGIGNWSIADFANAMLKGVAPDGSHYYPAFPYASYARMNYQDIADLFAFMKTLPAIEKKAPDHQLGFPFNIRRGLGLWKHLNVSPDPVIQTQLANQQVRRGQYLVEGPGHCGECHTPRDPMGGLVLGKWLAGAPAATGDGFVPNLTDGDKGLSDWSIEDIAYYLESGFTPDYDSVGGEMVSVQENMARLTAEDRTAIAAYLKAIPAQASAR